MPVNLPQFISNLMKEVVCELQGKVIELNSTVDSGGFVIKFPDESLMRLSVDLQEK